MRYTLRKSEILRGHRAFSEVLSKGKSIQCGSIRCFFMVSEDPKAGILVGFSVSRSIRKAPTRNRLKRLMREAYRKNRSRHLQMSRTVTKNPKVVFLFLARSSKEVAGVSFADVEKDMISTLRELQIEL